MAILAHVTLIRDNCSIVRVLLTYYTAANYCAKYFINSALVKEQYNIALVSVVENFTRIQRLKNWEIHFLLQSTIDAFMA